MVDISSKKDCPFESTEPDDAKLFKDVQHFELMENAGAHTRWKERYFLDRKLYNKSF